MKKSLLSIGIILIGLTIGSCEKENIQPNTGSNVSQSFKNSLYGEWKQVGEKLTLFNTWTYQSTGCPQFEIGLNEIMSNGQNPVWQGQYQFVNDSTIYLNEQKQFVKVKLGVDTTLFTLQNGNQYKCVIK